jgi:hypothetical protein
MYRLLYAWLFPVQQRAYLVGVGRIHGPDEEFGDF